MNEVVGRLVAKEAFEAAERALIAEFGDFINWEMILEIAVKAMAESGYVIDERVI